MLGILRETTTQIERTGSPCGWLTLGGWFPPSCSLTSPPPTGHREKIRLKSLWVEIKTGRWLNNYHYRQNRLDLGKFNLLQIKSRVGWWETKICTLLLPRLNFTCSFLALLPAPLQDPQGHGEHGQHIRVPLCYSFFLKLFPCSSVGPSHGLESLRAHPYAPLWSLQWLQGIFTQVPGAPPFPTPLRAHRAVTHIFPSLPDNIFPYLTQTVPKAPPRWLQGSAVPWGGWVGAAGASCVWQRTALVTPHRGALQTLGTYTPYQNGHFCFVKAKTVLSFDLLHFPLEK